jgi:DNA polymerase III delta prime subunit
MNIAESVTIEREYLQAVLSWLDARLEREVRGWQAAGQDPADRFRGLYISDQEALSLIRRGAGSRWSSGQDLSEDELSHLEKLQEQAAVSMSQLQSLAEEPGEDLRLKALQETFNLSEFEWWALVICLAPALDLRYERIYAYLQDDVTRTTASVDLILNLLLPEGLSRLDAISAFDRHAPLRRFRLLVPVGENGKSGNTLRRAFTVPQPVVSWLLGDYTPEELDLYLPLEGESGPAAEIFGQSGIPEEDVFKQIHPFLSLYGDDRLRQDGCARQVAAALEKPLLVITLPQDAALQDMIELLYPAVRDARMLGALLYVRGGECLIDRDGFLLPDAFLAFRYLEDSVFIGSQNPFRFDDEMTGNDYPLMSVVFDHPGAAERADLWLLALEELADQLPPGEITNLAGQFVLTSGQIQAAAAAAMSHAVQHGRRLLPSDLYEAARLHSGHHLAELAQKIEPRYAWEDLVLPETPAAMLKELVNMVRSRPLVLETWGLGRKLTAGSGISALFTGPPGTGKTLAAQIIAHELGIDLYRIDLSTVVSKYIGETEKNLERIFKEAQASNAVLFFDEADAIFGKRSEVKDAHDRYANIEVGYLLQRMEAYDGIAILATNLRANLDEAFTRRLQFIVQFPFPEEDYRRRIWEVLMPPGLPGSENLDYALMAKRFKLAGGSIRNIIASAAFLAASDGGKVTMAHLMHGARREFQKMGKLLQEEDFAL